MTENHSWARIVLAATFAITLFGCTSGDDSSDDANNDDTPADTGDNVADTPARLGSFDANGDFRPGVIAASQTTLTSGQSSELTLRLRDGDAGDSAQTTSVFFSSPCTQAGDADITPSVVQNINDTITTTYTPRGCNTSDTVTARTSINGRTLEASVTLSPRATTAAALAFVATSNPQIGIQGTGILPPQSQITFRVTDDQGMPVPNQRVMFEPETRVGGITLSPQSARTNAQGDVSTTVTSGTQATTLQIDARTTGSDGRVVSGQSRALVVTTGLADQDSFSISAESLNIEGLDRDGVTTAISVRAADRFNNPVPDGTTINFRTEGGSIPGACQTTDGGCSVTFVSQNPRPDDGRVTVLATATGEESFEDTNPSNGRFNAGEAFTDTREAFLDIDYDNARDPDEPYIDFNNNGQYDLKSGTFNGLLCNADDECAERNTIAVRDDLVIVLSGSSLFIDLPAMISLGDNATTINVAVRDSNDQVPPSGTTVAATTTQGTIEGPSSFTVPATNQKTPYVASFRLEPSGSEGQGVFRVTVTTPSDTISRDTATVVEAVSD